MDEAALTSLTRIALLLLSLFFTVSLGVLGWLVRAVISHGTEIAKNSTVDEEHRRHINEKFSDLKDERDRRFKGLAERMDRLYLETKQSDDRLWDKLSTLADCLSQMRADMSKISRSFNKPNDF